MKGTVKFFNDTKGYGFITPDDGSKDVFVHASGLQKGTKIAQDDKVTFDAQPSPKGMNAVNVAIDK